jgi:hypothetical protein
MEATKKERRRKSALETEVVPRGQFSLQSLEPEGSAPFLRDDSSLTFAHNASDSTVSPADFTSLSLKRYLSVKDVQKQKYS